MKQQHFTLSRAPAYRFLKFHEAVRTGHWTTMNSLAMQFVCMHTNHLAMKQLLFKIAK